MTRTKSELKCSPDGVESLFDLAGAEWEINLEYLNDDLCFRRGESSSKLLFVPASEVDVWSWLRVKIESLSECSCSASSRVLEGTTEYSIAG